MSRNMQMDIDDLDLSCNPVQQYLLEKLQAIKSRNEYLAQNVKKRQYTIKEERDSTDETSENPIKFKHWRTICNQHYIIGIELENSAYDLTTATTQLRWNSKDPLNYATVNNLNTIYIVLKLPSFTHTLAIPISICIRLEHPLHALIKLPRILLNVTDVFSKITNEFEPNEEDLVLAQCFSQSSFECHVSNAAQLLEIPAFKWQTIQSKHYHVFNDAESMKGCVLELEPIALKLVVFASNHDTFVRAMHYVMQAVAYPTPPHLAHGNVGSSAGLTNFQQALLDEIAFILSSESGLPPSSKRSGWSAFRVKLAKLERQTDLARIQIGDEQKQWQAGTM